MSLSFIYPSFLWLLLIIPPMLALGLLSMGRFNRSRLLTSSIIRGLLLLLLVFSLAGLQLRLKSDVLTTVFILDASDSVSLAEQARGESLIRQLVHDLPPGDKAAVVIFGEDALVERLASDDQLLAELTSIPITVHTNIASALQLAQAVLPDEGAKRLVLFSDGRQNIGEAIEQAELAASQDIELLYVPLESMQDQVEVLIDQLEVPGEIRQGENFVLSVAIQSSSQVNATLRIFAGNSLIHSKEIQLQLGANNFQLENVADLTQSLSMDNQAHGFLKFDAQIIPDADTRLQNNQASGFTVVNGPPNILIVEGVPGEGESIENALKAVEMHTSRITPASIPTNLEELANYDAIILVDIHASKLPSSTMETLRTLVRDLGVGLAMVGGPESFGAGGYIRTPLEEALPVDMEVKDKDVQANLALVVAVDKSGSMGSCHCDNPDLHQTYTPVESSQPKVDIAKEAIMRSASALGSQDYLGVVAFDSQPKWILELKKLVDPLSLEQAISSFKADGQTNIVAGVETAYQALQNISAKRKHVILMTDGWVHQGDLTPIAQEMSDQDVTLSIVAAGDGSAEYLKAIAEIGGGSFYPAVDILNVPDIFLKETVKSAGEYIIEEPFHPLQAVPSSVLRGVDVSKLPTLLGYNGTSAKKTARLDLITERGDPLLATWQYGLGRSAAWTSDFKGQWAINWLNWEGFPKFVSQLIGWILPTSKAEGLSAEVNLEETKAVINLEAVDRNGLPLNFLQGVARIVDPEENTVELPLKQTGIGQYQASMEVSIPGTYLVRLGVNNKDQSLGQLTLGFVVPFSPEYRLNGADRAFLENLAQITGGSELVDLREVFTHNLPVTQSAREIWQPVLIFVALLFPLDVAVRRLNLRKQDFRKVYIRLQEYISKGKTQISEQTPMLGQLFSAREHTRQSRSLPKESNTQGKSPPKQDGSLSVEEATPSRDTIPSSSMPAPGEAGTSGDSLDRLREAKKRAKSKIGD